MKYINTLEDLMNACSNPYCSGEYLTDGVQIFEVSINTDENISLIQSYDEPNKLEYRILWEGTLHTNKGTTIIGVYEDQDNIDF